VAAGCLTSCKRRRRRTLQLHRQVERRSTMMWLRRLLPWGWPMTHAEGHHQPRRWRQRHLPRPLSPHRQEKRHHGRRPLLRGHRGDCSYILGSCRYVINARFSPMFCETLGACATEPWGFHSMPPRNKDNRIMWVFPHIVPVQGPNALHPAVDCGGDYHRVCAVLRDPEGVGLDEDEQQA
jgi:hypothetical protein